MPDPIVPSPETEAPDLEDDAAPRTDTDLEDATKGETPDLEDDHALDAARLATEPPTACLNCGSVLPGRFCPDCGQKDQPLRQPAHVFIAESVSEYFGLDGRLWRSVGALLFKPGALTEAYLDGRRSYYLRPLRLYLSATVFFFFLLSFKGGSFALSQNTLDLEVTPRDSLIELSDLEDRIEDRIDIVDASLDAYRTATVAMEAVDVSGLGDRDSLEASATQLDTLRQRLHRADSLISGLMDIDPPERYSSDSLVIPSTMTPPIDLTVLRALEDSGTVRSFNVGGTVFGGLEDQLPDWMKGDLARRIEESESPAEQNMLASQYQRAILRQVPTVLFIVLPLFALLLKVIYIGGGGRNGRLRDRPLPPTGDVSRWRGLTYAVQHGWWRAVRARHRFRRRRARHRYLASETRTIRGAPRRFMRWILRHPFLARWRAWRLQHIRRGLRNSRTRYYSEHLVFALHVHAYTFLCLIPMVVWGWQDLYRGTVQDWVGVGLVASIPIYFLAAQHRVYQQTWLRTIVKSSVLASVYLVIIGFGTVGAAALALRLE